MATIEELKEKFSTGKTPTGDDFSELIDGVKGDKGDIGVRGSRIWTTTGITGTATAGTVFEDSGISGALIYDYALNKSTGNLYVCSKAGNADTAEWKYDSNIKGAKGDKGAAGAKGDPGADGQNGADGFGTETQYNDIIARLEALETAVAGDGE